LNDLPAELKSILPPTDSRLRPDQRLYEEGLVDDAELLKQKLEQKQRDKRAIPGSKVPAPEPPPQFFVLKSKGEYNYSGGYWEKRAKRNWSGLPDVF